MPRGRECAWLGSRHVRRVITPLHMSAGLPTPEPRETDMRLGSSSRLTAHETQGGPRPPITNAELLAVDEAARDTRGVPRTPETNDAQLAPAPRPYGHRARPGRAPKYTNVTCEHADKVGSWNDSVGTLWRIYAKLSARILSPTQRV